MGHAISASDVSGAMEKVRGQLGPEKSSLIPGLQVIQGELGYLPKEAMKALSDYIRVRESEIWGAASFYAQFRFTPVGRHKVTVCRGTACHVRGSANILRELERELGIKAGGTTPDLEFSLEEVACVGSCAIAPVQIIDGNYFGKMTSVKIKKQLAKLTGRKPGDSEDEKEEKLTVKKKPAAKTKPAAKAGPKKAKPKKAKPKPKAKSKAVKKTASRKKKAAKKKPSARKPARKKPVKKKAAKKKAAAKKPAKRKSAAAGKKKRVKKKKPARGKKR